MKVLQLCLSLIDISALLKVLDNLSVVSAGKKYDTDTSLSFSHTISYKPFFTAKDFINLTTK